MDTLPTELKLEIASHLCLSDLANCRLINRHWQSVATEHLFHTVTTRHYLNCDRMIWLAAEPALHPHVQCLRFEIRDLITDDEGNTISIDSAKPGARYIGHDENNLHPYEILLVLQQFMSLSCKCPITKVEVYMEGHSAALFQVSKIPTVYQTLFTNNITDLDMHIAYVNVGPYMRRYVPTYTPGWDGMAGHFMNTFQNLSRLSLRSSAHSNMYKRPTLALSEMIGRHITWPSLRSLHLAHMKDSEEALVSVLQCIAATLQHVRISDFRLISGSWVPVIESLRRFQNLKSAFVEQLHWGDGGCDGCFAHPLGFAPNVLTPVMEEKIARFIVAGGKCPSAPPFIAVCDFGVVRCESAGRGPARRTKFSLSVMRYADGEMR